MTHTTSMATGSLSNPCRVCSVWRFRYLFIEGDSEVAVGAARRELLRIINEEATRASSRPGGGGFSGGKYSIL